MSHLCPRGYDQITRFISEEDYTSKDLWRETKAVVRDIEQDDGCLIFDDTVQEKAWTDENELVCWHYDHSKGRSVKGINLLNAPCHSGEVSVPVASGIVRKPHVHSDLKDREVKRASAATKNELMRGMMAACVANRIKFRHVLMDSWYAATENFDAIIKHDKHFIAALKSNRLVALTAEDKKQGRFVRVSELELSDKQAVRGWLKGFDRGVLLIRRVFTNQDGGTGQLDLVCGDLTCGGEKASAIHQKRWKVEEFHDRHGWRKCGKRIGNPRRQVTEIESGLGEVAHPDTGHAEQPCVHGDCGRVQIGVLENKNQGQPFRHAGKIVHQGEPDGL